MEQVSWQMYVISVGLVTGAYYLYVGLWYYRQDFSSLVKRIFKPPERPEEDPPLEEAVIQVAELEALSQVSRQLEAVFDELAGIKVTKEEVLLVAREKLSGFTELKKQVVRETLQRLIARKAKEAFQLELPEEDLRLLWQQGAIQAPN